MKIAIIANTRTGSTTLFKYVKHSLDLYGIHEPFNPRTNLNYSHINIWELDNIVVKYIFVTSEYIKKVIKHFDKVIFLTREDDIESAKSFIHAKKTDNWIDSYVYREEYSKEIDNIVATRNDQKNFLRSFGGFQITYEELFFHKEGVERINQYLGIQNNNYKSLLDLKYRYRKGTSNKDLDLF